MSRLFGLLCLILMITSCALPIGQPRDSPGAAPVSESSGDSTAIDAGGSSHLPEIVGKSQRAMILLERAENVLIAECMAGEGFDFIAPMTADVDTYINDVEIARLTPAVAESEGYSSYLVEPANESDSSAPQVELAQDYFHSLIASEQQRFLTALEGNGDSEVIVLDSGVAIPVGGCIGEARVELLGERILEVFDVFYTMQFLQVDVWDDATVGQALHDWQSCMLQSGYRFENPDAAVNAGVTMRANRPTPSAEELTLAGHDARCRIDSNLIDAVEDAFVRLNREVVRQNKQVFADWSEIERFVLDRAGDILGRTLTSDPPVNQD